MTANPIEDQLDAAEREAEHLFRNAGDMVGQEIVCGSTISFKVSEKFHKSLESPEARICPHSAPGPRPIFGAAILPGVVGCFTCMEPLIRARRTLDEMGGNGRTCDGCGEKAMEGMEGLIRVGALLLYVNLCMTCEQQENS